MARELVIDLRAELPRIDARAAAGAALTAAVLVSVVTQAPIPMPVYAFGVTAAVLLTLALLLFLLVLFPTSSVARHPSTLRGRGRVETSEARSSLQVQASKLAAELADTDQVEFYTRMAIRAQAHIRTKQTLLALAFFTGLSAIAALAFGASLALLLGWR